MFVDIGALSEGIFRRTISNCRVQGVLTRKVAEPPQFARVPRTHEGSFMAFRLFSIILDKPTILRNMDFKAKANGFDKIVSGYDRLCFCSGELFVFVQNGVVPDWYEIRGNIKPEAMTGTVYQLLNWAKGKTNKDWILSPSTLYDVDAEDFEGEYYTMLEKSIQCNTILQPQIPFNYFFPTAEPNTGSILNVGVTQAPQQPVVSVPVIGSSGVSDTTNNDVPVISLPNSNVINLESSQATTSNNFVQSTSTPPSNRSCGVQVVSRDKAEPMSEHIKTLDTALKSAQSCKKQSIRQIELECGINEPRPEDFDDNDPFCDKPERKVNRYMEYTIKQMNKFWKRKPIPNKAFTGEAMMKVLFEKLGSNTKKKVNGVGIVEYVMKAGSDLLDFWALRKRPETIVIKREIDDLLEWVLGDPEVAYAGVLAQIVGVRVKDLADTARMCSRNNISFSQVVNSNPYYLSVIDPRLSFSILEDIAVSLGAHTKESNIKWRNTALLYYKTTVEAGGTTAYTRDELLGIPLGYELTSYQYDGLKKNGTTVSVNTQVGIQYYINSKILSSDWGYPMNRWERSPDGGYIYKLSSQEAVDDFLSTGLGTQVNVEGVNWISNTSISSKEAYIYNKIYDLLNVELKVDKDLIEDSIVKFEEMNNAKLGISESDIKAGKGFKLEKEQGNAVRLINNNVMILTGPAGSGKTTTAEAMVYAIEEARCSPSIVFAAPTGKAAKRLQEVVGRDVRTIHSLFRVMGESVSELDDEENNSAIEGVDVLIIDESSMITINLMYEILTKVSRPQIIFLGDKEQLPPIGHGKPFVNFLSFVPSVALTVTKRSSEKSGITRNAKSIIYNSNKEDWSDLVDTEDFVRYNCSDNDIKNVVLGLCGHHLGKVNISSKTVNLGKLDPDDIQVITPVGKAQYSWGTEVLNKELQNLFNPLKSVSDRIVLYLGTKVEVQKEYRIGDRVIHTENQYNKQQYSTWRSGKLTKATETGVMNGDVGYIVGMLDSTKCIFEDNEDDEGTSHRSKSRQPENDQSFVAEGNYFLVVQYISVDTRKPYYILYKFTMAKQLCTNEFAFVYSIDLKSLQLAYALTIHKMQGSQSKLIIFALGAVKREGFMSRNMIYTGITRAQKACYVVGSVDGSSSVLSVARLNESSSKRNTVLGMLTGTNI